MLRTECKEDVLLFLVQPETIRAFVPVRFTPALDASGSALVLVVAQKANVLHFDEENVGMSDFLRVWVRIEGPEHQDSMPGADQTLPRLYWYSVFEGASNREVARRQTNAGFVTRHIDRVNLGLLDAAGQSEILLDSGPCARWWPVDPGKPVSSQKIGIDHVVYRCTETESLNTYRARAIATAHRFFEDGLAHVVIGSELAKYLDPKPEYAIQFHHFRPIKIRIEFARGG